MADTSSSMPGPRAGQKVVFLGDSITQFGLERPAGYVRLIESALYQVNRPIVVRGAGVIGNTSKDLLARLEKDVLRHKPDWMLLSCGVNDVGHSAKGVSLVEYKKNITAILDRVGAAGITAIILTATMLGENAHNSNNQKLIGYNKFLIQQAEKRHLLLADLNAEMQATLAKAKRESHPRGNILTTDGIHMNGLGFEMMAIGILKVLGFTKKQLARARDQWLDIPAGAEILPKINLSLRKYLRLRGMAARHSISVDDVIYRILEKEIDRS